MKTAGVSLTQSCVILILAAMVVPRASSQSYAVTDLGSLDAGSAVDVSYASGINNFGDVVGSSYVGMSLHAYLWTKPQGMKDLGTLGGSNSVAYAVNNSGTVVGQTDLANSDTHAFLWTKPGGMRDLGTLGGSESVAFGINEFGQIVGESYPANGVAPHAFLWTAKNGMQDLGTLGGSASHAYAINNRGEVVGSSSIAGDSDIHAFVWSKNNGMRDLGTIGSLNPSYAYSINDLGNAVGYAGTTDPFTNTFGFLWDPGTRLKPLGSLDGGTQSFAYGINLAGEIVGSFNSATGSPHAFRWTGTNGMQDLNRLIVPNSGWMLNQANAVNNVSKIVGSGPVLINGGYTNHAFLLTPK